MKISWFKKFPSWKRLIITIASIVLILAAMLIVVTRFAIFGQHQLYAVLSNSMAPTIPQGSLVIVRSTMSTSHQANAIKEGQIILFLEPGSKDRLITHRVQHVLKRQNDSAFMTKGDANALADPWIIPAASVRGVYVYHLPYLGSIAQFAQSKIGTVLLIILPAIIILTQEIRNLVHLLVARELSKLKLQT